MKNLSQEKKLKKKCLVIFAKKSFALRTITRKMHLTSDFVLPKMILADKTANICYKFLKVEQAGERLHQIWNLLYRTRFFSVRNGKSQLLYAFMEYENLLYIPRYIKQNLMRKP